MGRALERELAGDEYRRSEETWDEAGRPTARIAILPAPNELMIDIAVHKTGELTFVPSHAVNPYDNESPDINGDGVQFYLADSSGASAWMLVPDAAEQGRVRTREIGGWDSPRELRATWHRIDGGYSVHIRVAVATLTDDAELTLGVVVNEKPPTRERRRGQLVLGGQPGEFVYLRGDREDINRLPRFTIAP
jgi:hypothetical protein